MPKPAPVALIEIPVPQYTETPLARTKFPKLVSYRATLRAKISRLEAEYREAGDSILNLMIRYDQKAVLMDHYRVTRVDTQRSSISKTRLLEVGVKPVLIEKATTTTNFTALRIKDLNEANGEGEE